MYHHPYPVPTPSLTDNHQTQNVSPLSFQQTQLQAEETFYATFPEARLAKLAEEEQYLMRSAISFHYDIQPDHVQYHSDSSGTGYVYVPVGDDNLPSPRPPDPSNSYIHNPSDFLHFNYGPNDTVTASTNYPIPSSILENDSLINVVQGSHYSSSVLEYTEPPHIHIAETDSSHSPVPALQQGFYRAPPQPILLAQEPVLETRHYAPVPQQPAPFEPAYATSRPDFVQSPVETSPQGYFYPPPPSTPSDLATSPQSDDVQEGAFRAVVPSHHPRHHSIDASQTTEHPHRNQGSTHSSSSHPRRSRDHHRHGLEHRLSRSHSHLGHPRQAERMSQRGMPWVGSQPTQPGTSMPLSPLSSKRQLEKKPPLACLFCRGRKIACGPPMPGSPDKTCNQCQRRSLRCEYPAESRRGMRKKKVADPASNDSTSIDKEHLDTQFSATDTCTSDLPKPAA